MQRFCLYTLLLLLFATPSLTVYAQDHTVVQKSTEKVRIDGKVCYIHNVKKGETIYSLCQTYNVSEETLVAYNPQLTDGLKVGQVLKIPDMPQAAPAGQQVPAGQVKHEVKQKETLYSIAQQYGCTVEDIKQANPTIDTNIQKGQTLIIPSQKTAQASSGQAAPKSIATEPQPVRTQPTAKPGAAPTGNHIYHTVLKGETLYSIIQRFAASEYEVKAINPDAFKNGELMEGAILRIPSSSQQMVAIVPTTTATTTPPAALFPSNYSDTNSVKSVPINTYSYQTGETFNVVLMLPLRNKATGRVPDSTSISKQSSSYLEFYEGALLAVDSLKRAGLSLELSVFDVYNDGGLNKALQSPELRNAQLIIGPIQKDLIARTAEFAQTQQIPVVFPTNTLSDSLVAQMNSVIEIKTPDKKAEQQLLKSVCKSQCNVVLVYKSSLDSALVNSYKRQLGAVKSLPYTIMRSRNELLAALSREKANHVVVVPCNDDAFITDFLLTLNLLTATNKLNVITYGDARWRKMSNLSIPSLYSLKLHIAQPFYIDYNSYDTKKFVADYRYYYKGEPSDYSFLGYDIAFYFLEMLKTYGSNFVPHLPQAEKDMLQSRFSFKQLENGGMKNQGVFTLEYLPSLDIVRK